MRDAMPPEASGGLLELLSTVLSVPIYNTNASGRGDFLTMTPLRYSA